MKIAKNTVDRIMVTEVPNMDPIAVYLEDHGGGKGKVTITSYGKAWTAYWGAMGCRIREFILSADNGYLIGKLDSSIARMVMAYDQAAIHARKKIVEQRRGRAITKRLARGYWEHTEAMEDVCCKDGIHEHVGYLQEIAGPFWYEDFPQEESSEYHHLNKIIATVKDAIRAEGQS